MVTVMSALLILPRMQLAEFCDQPWLRGWLRESYMDGLSLLFRLSGLYGKVARSFAGWAARTNAAQILDLASGAGGPAGLLLRAAQEHSLRLPKLVLSDLFPQRESWEQLRKNYGEEQITFIETPFDATSSQTDPYRVRAIFAAFHHLPPQVARSVLRSFTKNGDAFFIMEVMTRNYLHVVTQVLLLLPLTLLLAVCMLQYVGRRSFRQILVCTIFPLVPLMIVIDGVVSVLRTYRREEIEAMFPPDIRSAFHLDFAEIRYGLLYKANYISIVRR